MSHPTSDNDLSGLNGLNYLNEQFAWRIRFIFFEHMLLPTKR